jgi:hypothetical protein
VEGEALDDICLQYWIIRLQECGLAVAFYTQEMMTLVKVRLRSGGWWAIAKKCIGREAGKWEALMKLRINQSMVI